MIRRNANCRARRGVIIPLSAILMVVMFAMAALAIDMGYMFVVRTQLQAAADAGALAAGNSLHLSAAEVIAVGTDYVTRHEAGGRTIRDDETIVELGVWDAASESFAPVGSSSIGNAVRVTARRTDEALFFARVMGNNQFTTEASAIAMANPKDIVFVVDCSGSMNDDTEPAWATETVNDAFASSGFGSVGEQLMQDVYRDFGFGSFPGTLEYIGAPLGVPQGRIAYAELTSDDGPLSLAGTPNQYRIAAGDNEQTRREKSYRWIIDNQLSRLLVGASPAPTSANYRYWQKYIDYVLHASRVSAPRPPAPPKPPSPPKPPAPPSSGGGGSSGGGSGGGGGGTPPPPPPPPPPKPPIGWWNPDRGAPDWLNRPVAALALIGGERVGLNPVRGLMLHGAVYGAAADGPGLPRVGGMYGRYTAWVPPSQDGDRIDRFNNPNKSSFPSARSSLPRRLRNFFGYQTYVQFLMDHGRDLRPDGRTYVELSVDSGAVPMHNESVAGRSFRFPPREQPMHAARRSVIRAMDIVATRNTSIPSFGHRDRVAVVSFDTTDGSREVASLTANYDSAMNSVTDLQAVGDKGTTTATDTGVILAQQILKPASQGGQARENSTKVMVLLTDGIPNTFQSAEGDIDAFAAANPGTDFYGGGYYWLDAALMKATEVQSDRIDLFPVGIGLGTDYDFMDRMARAGGTANSAGQSSRGSGNPAEYEQRLVEIFERIIRTPVAKLVQ